MMQGLIGYDKGYKFYSNCNGKPLEKKISSREMKMFGLGLKKKIPLAALWRMDHRGSREEVGKLVGEVFIQ